MTRFIKLPNSFYEKWEGYPKVIALAVHLLFKAARKDGTIAGQEILRGQLLTSLSRLSKETRLSSKEIRNALNTLKKANFLGKVEGKVEGKVATLITICYYDSYNGSGQSRGKVEGKVEGKVKGRVGARFKENPPYNPHKELLQEKKERITKVIPKKEDDASFPDIPQKIFNENPIEDNPAPREENSNPQPPSSKFNVYAVMNFWNEHTKSVPKIAKLTDKRKEKIKLRLAEFGGTYGERKETFAKIIEKIESSDFLSGRSGKWKATFDWLFENEKNWLKVLEGNYDNLKIEQDYGKSSRSDPYVRRRGSDVTATSAQDYNSDF